MIGLRYMTYIIWGGSCMVLFSQNDQKTGITHRIGRWDLKIDRSGHWNCSPLIIWSFREKTPLNWEHFCQIKPSSWTSGFFKLTFLFFSQNGQNDWQSIISEIISIDFNTYKAKWGVTPISRTISAKKWLCNMCKKWDTTSR